MPIDTFNFQHLRADQNPIRLDSRRQQLSYDCKKHPIFSQYCKVSLFGRSKQKNLLQEFFFSSHLSCGSIEERTLATAMRFGYRLLFEETNTKILPKLLESGDLRFPPGSRQVNYDCQGGFGGGWMRQEPKNSGNALEYGIETESRLQLIVDTTPALSCSARPDGYIDFFNQHCLEFLGLPFEEISGWGWTKTIHADDIEAFLAEWRAPNRFKPLHYRPYLVSTCNMQKSSRNVRSWRCQRKRTPPRLSSRIHRQIRHSHVIAQQ